MSTWLGEGIPRQLVKLCFWVCECFWKRFAFGLLDWGGPPHRGRWPHPIHWGLNRKKKMVEEEVPLCSSWDIHHLSSDIIAPQALLAFSVSTSRNDVLTSSSIDVCEIHPYYSFHYINIHRSVGHMGHFQCGMVINSAVLNILVWLNTCTFFLLLSQHFCSL